VLSGLAGWAWAWSLGDFPQLLGDLTTKLPKKNSVVSGPRAGSSSVLWPSYLCWPRDSLSPTLHRSPMAREAALRNSSTALCVSVQNSTSVQIRREFPRWAPSWRRRAAAVRSPGSNLSQTSGSGRPFRELDRHLLTRSRYWESVLPGSRSPGQFLQSFHSRNRGQKFCL
jgi:hypothetical protein